ncbi:cytidine deaminase [Mycoplasmopsis cricetuli]|uniref:cytidine deaminase n=1 Tax=Mycoplasmopsis cricetuli TaxID=171283 RepID=UPI00046FFB56|nr:cytidine deaminase [Mycoplasmopsis cricetuli]
MDIKYLKKLLEKAYAPYSNFQVAACAIDANGKEFYGVNVENAAFPSGTCAERAALFGSVAYGGIVGKFKEIHVISKKKDIISPCAGCRQVITEFMPQDGKIYQYSNDGTKVRINTVKELVPFSILESDIK